MKFKISFHPLDKADAGYFHPCVKFNRTLLRELQSSVVISSTMIYVTLGMALISPRDFVPGL